MRRADSLTAIYELIFWKTAHKWRWGSTSYNCMGLHGLLQGYLYFVYFENYELESNEIFLFDGLEWSQWFLLHWRTQSATSDAA
jgi:hypothetical protein